MVLVGLRARKHIIPPYVLFLNTVPFVHDILIVTAADVKRPIILVLTCINDEAPSFSSQCV